MDDFFVSTTTEHSIVDPDARIPKKKRKMMMQAARAHLASTGKRSRQEEESSSDGGMGDQGIDDMDLAGSDHESQSDSESEKETAAQKRLRLAKRYLDKLKEEVVDETQEGDIDAAQIDRDLIADRLKDDAVGFRTILMSRSSRPLANSFTAYLKNMPTWMSNHLIFAL